MASQKLRQKLTKFFEGFQDRMTADKPKGVEVPTDSEVKIE